MSRNYDNWERLVEAVIRREQLRQLCLDSSTSPSPSSSNSDSSLHEDISFRPAPSPLHPGVASSAREGKQNGSIKEPRKRRNMWKGLSIFNGFYSKKYHDKVEIGTLWATEQRTLYGLEPMRTGGPYSEKYGYKELSQLAEESERRAEIARLRELHTLKGHIESVVKLKGLDINPIAQCYTF